MKKIIVLGMLITALGGISIVSNAKEAEKEICSVTLEDIDENGEITYKDILDYTVKVKVQKYDNNSEEAKEFWSIHEEVKKMTDNEAKQVLEQVILQ